MEEERILVNNCSFCEQTDIIYETDYDKIYIYEARDKKYEIHTNIENFIPDHNKALNYYRYHAYLAYNDVNQLLAHLYLLFYSNVSKFYTFPFSIERTGSFEFRTDKYYCKLSKVEK